MIHKSHNYKIYVVENFTYDSALDDDGVTQLCNSNDDDNISDSDLNHVLTPDNSTHAEK